MVEMKHGSLVWVDLNPYLNKRVLGKFIDYSKFYKVDDFGIISFDGAFRVYDLFYDTESYSSSIPRTTKLLCHPILSLFTRDLWKNMTIVGKEKVIEKEAPLFDLRSHPNNLDFDANDFKEEYSNKYYDRNYNITSASNGLPYCSVGEHEINQCSHLDYNLCAGSTYFYRSRIFLEYMKKYDRTNLSYDLFGKLPEYLKNPEKGGDDRFIYTRYAKMSLLSSLEEESYYKLSS